MTDADGSELPAILAGGKAGLARALARIESAGGTERHAALLDAATAAARGRVVGLTGPPGVGKSTLIAALIRAFRAEGRTVGVLAVDPSSAFTGGALLGDRTRFRSDPDDGGLFVRSAAARDRLGGLSDTAVAAAVLMRAAFDVVIVETVGIGQSEADIGLIADVVVLCVQPGAGDTLQFMKAGIMELPDIFVVTKADLSREASRARHELEAAVGMSLARTLAGREGEGPPRRPAVVSVSAAEGDVAALLGALAAAFEATGIDALARRRLAQQRAWVADIVKGAFGTRGLAAWRAGHPPDPARPFAEAARAIGTLAARLEGAAGRGGP